MFIEHSVPYGPPLPPRPAPAQPPFIRVGGAGTIPSASMLRQKKYFHPAPAARLWVDEVRVVVDLDHVLQQRWHVGPIDEHRDHVRLIRLVHRRLFTAVTVVRVDQSEPRLYFATSHPDELRVVLRDLGWRVEEQRSRLRPWAPVD